MVVRVWCVLGVACSGDIVVRSSSAETASFVADTRCCSSGFCFCCQPACGHVLYFAGRCSRSYFFTRYKTSPVTVVVLRHHWPLNLLAIPSWHVRRLFVARFVLFVLAGRSDLFYAVQMDDTGTTRDGSVQPRLLHPGCPPRLSSLLPALGFLGIKHLLTGGFCLNR